MKRKRTPEERAADKAQYEKTMGMLRERIAYHEAKLEEERRVRDRPRRWFFRRTA
jgi:hypothetical protein